MPRNIKIDFLCLPDEEREILWKVLCNGHQILDFVKAYPNDEERSSYLVVFKAQVTLSRDELLNLF